MQGRVRLRVVVREKWRQSRFRWHRRETEVRDGGEAACEALRSIRAGP